MRFGKVLASFTLGNDKLRRKEHEANLERCLMEGTTHSTTMSAASTSSCIPFFGFAFHLFRITPSRCGSFVLLFSRCLTCRLYISFRHRSPDMRRDVQEIFRATPHHKQVMMFSATLAKEIRVTCKKFMANVGLLLCLLFFHGSLTLLHSLWRSSSTMRPSSRFTGSNNTMSSWRKLVRTGSSTSCLTHSSSIRYAA